MFEITIENSWEDVDGRVVLINAYFKTFKFSLCNIYAPNNAALQKVFIENLAEILISKADISNLIVVGDWNVTLEAVDKKGGIQWKPSVYRDLLVQFMDELNLVDILRIKNPGKKCFTYESSALKMKSRIDFLLIPKSLIASTKTADIKTAIAPDHKAIRLNLQFEIKKRGPVRALGIFISYNEQENDKKNVAKKIDNLNIKLDIWRGRKLSLFGKCLIVKTLGISQIVYSTSMLDISPNDTSRIKKSIFSFIWNKKPDKIKRNIMCQDYANGGLRAPDPDVLFKTESTRGPGRGDTCHLSNLDETWPD